MDILTSSELCEAIEYTMRNNPEALSTIPMDFKDETISIIGDKRISYYKLTYKHSKGNIIISGSGSINWDRLWNLGDIIGYNILRYDAVEKDLTWSGYIVFQDGSWIERKTLKTMFSNWVKGGDAPRQETSDMFKIEIDWNKK